MVLADPVACKHLNNINSQYAEVGVNAIPMQAKHNVTRHAMNVSLLPTRSAVVPQNMGAVGRSVKISGIRSEKG